ncbi:MAG: AI-2E family transporter [Candidatus Aminicenantes bacterium]|uniref:Transport protein n=1 Tax=Candidatus Saccharicenans subterraneus TaxID=2508984 RepID=A0A3E2BJP7_9BACT|nr:AI-2E family transporter [Candidatus Aminicenantes bacterium]RFT14836.1 MAG: transport protein [Candidatus Saccharicenans subterraneum]
MAESRLTRISLVIIVLFISGIILKIARPVLLPFLVALFISYSISPLLDWLVRLKVPKLLAIISILVLTFALLYLFGLLIYSSGKYFAAEFPKYNRQVDSLMAELIAWLEHLPFKVSVPTIISQLNVDKLTGLLLGTLGSFLTFLGKLLIVFVFVIFILSGRDKLPAKVATALAEERAVYVNRMVASINRQVQKYLAVKTMIALMNGLLAAGILILFGVDFALLFGFLTFVLDYIPSVGSITATVLAGLMAFFQFGNSLIPVWIFLLLVIMQTIIGNFLEPKLMGRSLNLSPLLVLFSLIFWGWLWGIAGMFLAVPLLAVIKIVFENVPSLKFLAVLMSK